MSLKYKLWESSGRNLEALGIDGLYDNIYALKTQVYVNGVKQAYGHDYVVNGTNIVFRTPPKQESRIDVILPDGTKEILYAAGNRVY